MEIFYLRSLKEAERLACYRQLFNSRSPVWCSRSLRPDEQMIAAAEAAKIPIFRTPQLTMNFISRDAESGIHVRARGSEMGSMVDIPRRRRGHQRGSGVGKSESVLALIERGYSLRPMTS